MRVAIVTESFLPHMNGVTGSVLQSVRHLTALGHETLVIAPGARRKKGFRPTMVGADLALKDYFIEVSFGASSFATRPYVSMASGRVCVTHARRVELSDGLEVVLCCDLPESLGIG